MANMREIRNRMKSIQDIQKITNAMYLISSSKVKKARKNLQQNQPYFDKSLTAMANILDSSNEKFKVFGEHSTKPESQRKKAFIVITADKGLCGSYNHNVIKIAEEKLKNAEDCSFLVVGQVGRIYFNRIAKNSPKIKFEEDFIYTSADPNIYRARKIAERVTDKFMDGTYDEVYIIYTKMTSSVNMEPKVLRLLPLDRDNFDVEKSNNNGAELRFHPSAEAVMDGLVPIFLKGVIYSAMVEGFCSEQQARMTAMDNATTSASDMLGELSLMYNRARQAAITQEITEVVGGSQIY